MPNRFKTLTNYFIAIGADGIAHSEKTYLAHAIGVYNDLKAWQADLALCEAGLFHSIYGTEGFQGFKLSEERRDELKNLIGERAEKLAYLNCFMERATLDNQLDQVDGPYHITHRESRETMALTKVEYDDLVRLHLCDWLEQVGRSKRWDYRCVAYRKMAVRLGGAALEAYDKVFAKAYVNA